MIKELTNLLLVARGYPIALGVELAICLICGMLLILLLSNSFAKKEKAASTEEASSEPRVIVVEREQAAAATAEESPVEIIREINTVYVPVNMGGEQAEPAPAPVEAEEKQPEKEKDDEKQPIIINVYNNEEKETEAAPAGEGEEGGVKFQNKTIEELYEELSNEQKSFFDELKNTALAKPNATLSITKTYENVKIGKRSIIKLIIRRGVTVAEFLLENDALKEYRLSSQNKKGKSKIKIRPTVLAVTELDTLKAAVDMIHLAYQQIIEE